MTARSFQRFFQLAYVTTDIDRALGVFAEDYDVPRFGRLGEISLPLDDGGETRIEIALCFVGDLQLEVIEPRGGRDDIYRRALPIEGFGLVWHHAGFKLPSIEAFEEAREEITQRGHGIALAGGSPSTSVFFYADTRDALGHYLEYIYLSPARQQFHDELPHH